MSKCCLYFYSAVKKTKHKLHLPLILIENDLRDRLVNAFFPVRGT